MFKNHPFLQFLSIMLYCSFFYYLVFYFILGMAMSGGGTATSQIFFVCITLFSGIFLILPIFRIIPIGTNRKTYLIGAILSILTFPVLWFPLTFLYAPIFWVIYAVAGFLNFSPPSWHI